MSMAMAKWIALALLAVGAPALAGGSDESGGGAAAQSNASAGATAATSVQGGSSATLESGTTINAVLSRNVDAGKAKPGDSVEARTQSDVKSAGKSVIPKGSKLLGHVTVARARTNGQAESALGMIFDKAVLKDGQELALQTTLQAVAPSVYSLEADSPAAMGSITKSGGPVASTGGVVGKNGELASNGARWVPIVGGRLTSTAEGVIMMEDLRFAPELSNATVGTVLASSHNVKLESGTQLVLRATGQ